MDDWSGSDLPAVASRPARPAAEQRDGGNTDAFFCNAAYDKLFAQQATEFNQAQRVQTVDQMQQILYNANVDIMLYYADNLSAVRTDHVKDFFYGKANAQGFYPQQNLFINWRTADSGGHGG